tara:strand:+ start:1442 stop:2080 length:639 start_codon:yes stop_codon:yes gene_type:complete
MPDQVPLFKEFIGDYIYDPLLYRDAKRNNRWENLKTIPIFYTTMLPVDFVRKPAMLWSIITAATSSNKLCRNWSEFDVADVFYVAFPMGVIPRLVPMFYRKEVRFMKNFCFEHEEKTFKDGLLLPFTFNQEQLKETIKYVKTHNMAEAKKLTISQGFDSIDLEESHVQELDWYHDISTWEGYINFIKNERRVGSNYRPKYYNKHQIIGEKDG